MAVQVNAPTRPLSANQGVNCAGTGPGGTPFKTLFPEALSGVPAAPSLWLEPAKHFQDQPEDHWVCTTIGIPPVSPGRSVTVQIRPVEPVAMARTVTVESVAEMMRATMVSRIDHV
jgi:hypothetical protein